MSGLRCRPSLVAFAGALARLAASSHLHHSRLRPRRMQLLTGTAPAAHTTRSTWQHALMRVYSAAQSIRAMAARSLSERQRGTEGAPGRSTTMAPFAESIARLRGRTGRGQGEGGGGAACST
jgi:hypothetical protein